MSYLSHQKDVRGLLLERTENYGCYLMPRYYQGNWQMAHLCYSKEEELKYKDVDFVKLIQDKNINYCLFIEEDNIEERVGKIKTMFPEMQFMMKIEPSYIDKLLHFLNPRNQNENIYIYRLY